MVPTKISGVLELRGVRTFFFINFSSLQYKNMMIYAYVKEFGLFLIFNNETGYEAQIHLNYTQLNKINHIA